MSNSTVSTITNSDNGNSTLLQFKSKDCQTVTGQKRT